MYCFGLGSAGLVLAGQSAVFCPMPDHTFRLKNTPLGNLVVKFYQVEPYSAAAFERVRLRDFWLTTAPGSGNTWALSLYQGPIADNHILPEAIAQLHTRCAACNCVRIERPGG
jgi:hypothetical protein